MPSVPVRSPGPWVRTGREVLAVVLNGPTHHLILGRTILRKGIDASAQILDEAMVMKFNVIPGKFRALGRATTITAWVIGHGLALVFSPTSVVLVGGLAIAKVGYDSYLRFVWPLLLALFAVSTTVIGLAATFG